MPTKLCSDCKFYVVTDQNEPGYGICVRNAPSLDAKDRDERHQYPEVHGTNQNVCGEFKNKS